MKNKDIEKLMNDTLSELLEGKEVEVKLTLGECSMLFTTLKALLMDKTMPDEIREKLVSVKEKVDLDNFDIRTLRDECVSILAGKVAEELMKDLENEDDKERKGVA